MPPRRCRQHAPTPVSNCCWAPTLRAPADAQTQAEASRQSTVSASTRAGRAGYSLDGLTRRTPRTHTPGTLTARGTGAEPSGRELSSQPSASTNSWTVMGGTSGQGRIAEGRVWQKAGISGEAMAVHRVSPKLHALVSQWRGRVSGDIKAFKLSIARALQLQ